MLYSSLKFWRISKNKSSAIPYFDIIKFVERFQIKMKVKNKKEKACNQVVLCYSIAAVLSGYSVFLWIVVWKWYGMEFKWNGSMLWMWICWWQSRWDESRMLDFRTWRRTIGRRTWNMFRTGKNFDTWCFRSKVHKL